MLPNAKNVPATRPKRAVNQPVSLFVGLQLALPKRAVIPWKIRVFRGAMPEASVHKNCQLELGKDKIRLAKYWRMATPAGDALAAE